MLTIEFWKYKVLILLIFLFNGTMAQVSFTPTIISGLKLWLIGDSVSLDNSQLIDTIYDLSGNINHAIQLSTEYQTKLNPVLFNGHKSILFDGNDDFYNLNEINDIRTIFWVIKDGNITTNFFRPLLGHSSSYDFYRSSIALWDNTYTSSFIRNGITKLNSIMVDGTATNLSSQYSLVDIVTTGNISANSLSRDRNIIDRVWYGDIAEVIIYNQALSHLQVIQVEEYLNNKYAPPIQLPNDISITNSICDTLLKLNNPNNNQYSNYLWSTGDTTSTISVNRPGTYWVKAKNIFGKETSDTIVVQFPELRLPMQNQFCQNQSLIWNTQLSNQLFNFQWSNGSTNSLLNTSQPGNYYVTVTDSFGCSITSDTIIITQDNFPTTASLGPDTTLCAGNRICLMSGNQAGLSYLWNNNTTDSVLIINNSGQYSVSVTNQNNCVAKDTINVNISGQAPIAGFENTTACLNTSIQFTDTSRVTDGSSINQWFWDFGNTTSLADTSIITNPSYTFADTGSYQITLFVKSTQGCSQSIQKNIRVYPKPIVDYYSSIACQNDTTSFFSTINALGYPTASVIWNFGDPISGANNQSLLSNSTHIFSQAGNFQVKLIAENNKQCKDSITKSISVKNEVSANFNFSTACVGSPITFTDNSIVPAPNTQNVRLWNFYPGSSGGLTVNKTYPSAGTYSVTLTVNGYNGCISSITKNIEVHLPPIADFAIDTICKNDTVVLQDLSLPQQGNLSSWQWKLNNQLIAQIQQPTYIFNSSGNFNLKLITQNSFGCRDSISKNSTVYSLPNATISSNADPYYFIGEPVQFNTSSTNFSSYVWLIDSTNTFTVAQPTFTFNSSGDYPIQLTVEDSLGCSAKGNKTVSVTSRILDVAVQQALASVDTFGFVKVTAELHNLGTSPITAFDIMFEINGTEKVKESWAGSFPPNSILQYTFNREVYLQEFQQKNALNCIRVLSVNSKQDANLNNNQSCSSLINNENFVADPFPNPGKNKFTIPVNLKDAQSIQIEVKDVLGKSLLNEKTSGNKGINFIQLNAEKWESGIYFFNIIINESTFFQKKIIRN